MKNKHLNRGFLAEKTITPLELQENGLFWALKEQRETKTEKDGLGEVGPAATLLGLTST